MGILAAALAVVLSFAVADSAEVIFSDSSYLSQIGGGDNASNNTSSVVSEPPEVVAPLVITSPLKTDTTVSQSSFAITGTSDPKRPVVLNGNAIERLESGAFSIDVELSPGKNVFVFEYNGTSVTYIIRYNFTVIKAYAPYEKQTYEAGSSFVAVAFARVNSESVTASFNGQTITLTPEPYEEGDDFTNFVGTFTLPTLNETDLNLGGVTFTGSCNGVVRSYTSPSIICLRDKALDKPQIVEIVASQAETFNGDTTDDYSRPTNSYLPQGTLDYKVGGIIYEPISGNSYYKLRCGKRVYINKENTPDPNRVTVSTIYEGDLPQYNTVTLSSTEAVGRHSVFTFDVAWRAPFSVDLAPQSYTNPSIRDYTVSKATFTYVDIKFFYTQGIEGDFTFSAAHPLFVWAQKIPVEDGCILRLHLKKAAAFYGWNADYNEQGQLVFKFLNAPSVSAQNDLTGIKILIDAGHGGKDIGAQGVDPAICNEAERNLSLALKLKAELENYGATVILTRTSDISLSADTRCDLLRQHAPDLCISLHHDSNDRASVNGGSVFCFNAFSNNASQLIFNRIEQGNFYIKNKKYWHYFFLGRVTSCPVILVENGFISSPQDFVGICDENTNLSKAKAICNGILDYFNSFVQ